MHAVYSSCIYRLLLTCSRRLLRLLPCLAMLLLVAPAQLLGTRVLSIFWLSLH